MFVFCWKSKAYGFRIPGNIWCILWTCYHPQKKQQCEHSIKPSSFVLHYKNERVWNNMWLSKWWQMIYFLGWTIHFNERWTHETIFMNTKGIQLQAIDSIYRYRWNNATTAEREQRVNRVSSVCLIYSVRLQFSRAMYWKQEHVF